MYASVIVMYVRNRIDQHGMPSCHQQQQQHSFILNQERISNKDNQKGFLPCVFRPNAGSSSQGRKVTLPALAQTDVRMHPQEENVSTCVRGKLLKQLKQEKSMNHREKIEDQQVKHCHTPSICT